MDQDIRLQKYIADCGVTSRRKAEELIITNRVKVNGGIVNELGSKVHPEDDIVAVDGEIIDPVAVDKLYLVFHKPRGCVTTTDDPEGRKTVMDYVQSIPLRLFPVGRLDYLSEGLLILTNDGDIANKIIHPSNDVEKVYEVKVFGRVNDYILNQLKRGVEDYDGLLKPKSVRVVEQLPKKTWLEFRLSEGKNREIRRICEYVGLTVDKLKRVAIGNLSVEDIAPGKFRMIEKAELVKKVGLDGKKPAKYISRKKSVKQGANKKKRSFRQKNGNKQELATNRKFVKYRKLNYNKTMAAHKRINSEAANGNIANADS